MRLGLIGHPLEHSWSPLIHNTLIGVDYSLYDLNKEEVESFVRAKEYDGLNVTIPYKETVIPYMDSLSKEAKVSGAINCIVPEGEELHGYNTDALGLKEMIEKQKIDVQDKKIAILGSGGACKASHYVLDNYSSKIDIVSRMFGEETITYEDLYEKADEYQVIVNTTPVGMYPHTKETPIDISKFKNIETVIDFIANPLQTQLLFEAKKMNAKTYGGFEILVRQAKCADELFTKKKLFEKDVKRCMAKVYEIKRNIVLIGMPTSGKSDIGKKVAKKLGKTFIDMDEEIEKRIKMSIANYFAKKGEEEFRKIEEEVAIDLEEANGVVIASGGGVVTKEKTMQALCANGYIVFVDRDLDKLFASKDRPLSNTKESIEELYRDRIDLYDYYSELTVKNNDDIDACVKKIVEKVREE